MKNIFNPLQALVGALFLFSVPAVCQEQSPNAAPIEVKVGLSDAELWGEKSLQVAVTFEAKRQKLPDALTALQAQSGVTLTLSPNSPFADKLLTARTKAMPLSDVLDSLGRLYGAAWVKRGDGFEMTSNGFSDIENAMWKFPTAQANAIRAATANPIDWNQEIENIGIRQLRRKEGVSWQEVDAETARRLREQLAAQDVPQLGISLDAARLSNLVKGKLEVTDESLPNIPTLKVRFFTPEEKLAADISVQAPPAAK